MLKNQDQRILELLAELDEGRSLPKSDLDKAFDDFPWLKKFVPETRWDKVVVYRYENDPATKIVEDPLFLESINWLLRLRSVGAVHYPSGYPTDIDAYTYEFYEGEQKYTINVVDRGVIEAGRAQQYFEVDNDIHQLGAAFMPKRWFVQHDGLISKMAASGAVRRGDQYIQLSSFRVQSRIAPLVDGTRLQEKPAQVGDRVERYTFYYYGTELIMDVYKDHVCLSGEGTEEWYAYEKAEYAFNVEAG